jgi:ABC-2 type transport system ATP-binding protein
MIEIKNLTKDFNGLKAIDNLCLKVPENEIFGLIGPDGSGKTTLMRMLAGIMNLTAGDILYKDKSITRNTEEIKTFLGYMPQKFSLYGDLSVMENINFYADIYLVPKKERAETIKKLLFFSNLSAFKDRPADKLSGGMKQKLGLSCALIHKPRMLLLDEPTNGVDPLSRREFWDILYDLKTQGVTILISTPYMDEAARCDGIALIDKGKLIFTGSPKKIKEEYAGNVIEMITSDNILAFEAVSALEGVSDASIIGEVLHLNTTRDFPPEIITNKLRENSISIIDKKSIEPTIEDVYIYFTKERQKLPIEVHKK